jgi:hypothetical protein
MPAFPVLMFTVAVPVSERQDSLLIIQAYRKR